MTQPARVLTIGSALIDTIAIIESDLIERMSMNNAERAFLLLEEGRKTEAAEISTHPGGGGVNTAVSFARQGCEVSAILKIGRDARGDQIKAALTAEGVFCGDLIVTDSAATGASVIISSHDKNAAIFTFRGANSLLKSEDLAAKAFARNIVYVCSLSDKSADLFPHVTDLAKRSGAFVAANPGVRQFSARGSALDKALANVDVLSMNRAEAAVLVPRVVSRLAKPKWQLEPKTHEVDFDLMKRGLTIAGFEMSFAHFVEAVVGLGPACVLITDGKRGAFAATRNEIIHCPSLPAEVVGTAGAGDAFSSTFVQKLATGSPAGAALQYASVNAASVVSHADTQTGLLKSDALEAAKVAAEPLLPVTTWKFA